MRSKWRVSGGLIPCSTFFTVDIPDGGAGVYGAGYSVLLVNDTIAADIGRKCIGVTPVDAGVAGSDAGVPVACDVLGFAACAIAVRQAATTPLACHPDGG